MMIYETDTDKVLVYNGSAWYANWNTAWGQVGNIIRTAGNFSVSTTQSDVTGVTTTFTAVSGRLYKATWGCYSLKDGNAGWVQVVCTNSSNTVLGSSIAYIPASNYGGLSGMCLISGISGSYTVKLRAGNVTGTATLYADSGSPLSFVVEDIGPA
jgi:hypothetical protein